jgi:hypothetical protein
MKLYNLFSSLFREEGWRLAGVVHVPVWARADARIACGVIAFACVSWANLSMLISSAASTSSKRISSTGIFHAEPSPSASPLHKRSAAA